MFSHLFSMHYPKAGLDFLSLCVYKKCTLYIFCVPEKPFACSEYYTRRGFSLFVNAYSYSAGSNFFSSSKNLAICLLFFLQTE